MNSISLKGGTKVAVVHEHFRGGVRILMWDENTYFTCQITANPISDKTQAIDLDDSFLRASVEEAQTLTDALHKAGFRPKGGQGTDAHIEALQQNLTDLRALVQVEAGHVASFFHLHGVRPGSKAVDTDPEDTSASDNETKDDKGKEQATD